MGDQEGTTLVTGTDDSESTGTAGDSDQSGGRTPEEIEAFWRNRVSNKDKAHAAAERALREEIASLKAQASQATRSSGQDGENSQVNAQVAALQKELETERQARIVDQRKAKYPALAAQAGSDDLFRISDEATLAKLNALADDNSGGGRTLIAPTNPQKSPPPPPKALKDMSKDDALAVLRRLSDAEVASRRADRGGWG